MLRKVPSTRIEVVTSEQLINYSLIPHQLSYDEDKTVSPYRNTFLPDRGRPGSFHIP